MDCRPLRLHIDVGMLADFISEGNLERSNKKRVRFKLKKCHIHLRRLTEIYFMVYVQRSDENLLSNAN